MNLPIENDSFPIIFFPRGSFYIFQNDYFLAKDHRKYIISMVLWFYKEMSEKYSEIVFL